MKACFAPGKVGHDVSRGPLMISWSIDWALTRTPASWSLYSTFPDAGQHFTERPKVALLFEFKLLTVNAGSERRSPKGENTGSSPGTCPPPVTFPGVDAAPPRHRPPGAGAISHGV